VSNYERKKARLLESWNTGTTEFRLAKATISNLFRYEARSTARSRLSLQNFNEIIKLDPDAMTLEVEGLATFETIVTHTLEHGLLPLVAPELKHITIGGAVVGIGIESTCYKHGFVHDGLLEADVLLPDGKIVTCTPQNEYADLFHALPNSYGTLGYILRAKIALQAAQPFIRLEIQSYADAGVYLDAMRDAVTARAADFIEGLVYQDGRYFLMLGRFEPALEQTDDIVHQNIFYKLVESRREIFLSTFDYIFRYDPEWFWNIPESWIFRLFRRYAPRRYRNSSFYTRYTARKARLRKYLPRQPAVETEPLIQDWQVPWDAARDLLAFFLEQVPLDGRPCAAVPIVAPSQPTLYPITPRQLYFNLGCYCHVRKAAGQEPYHYTRIMDRRCFELGGIKMLYSSSFLAQAEFDRVYNGAAYRRLKQKYDPQARARTLFEKVAIEPSGGP
jgi:FAD/FMN-containing dehydrogenase